MNLCIMGCGREATSRKHDVCKSCYSSLRYWSNVKTPQERAERVMKLLLYGRRVEAIDSKLVRIGTSPFKWRRNTKPIWRRKRK